VGTAYARMGAQTEAHTSIARLEKKCRDHWRRPI
jgi:hypothetical protein